jgi:hypothetical protein
MDYSYHNNNNNIKLKEIKKNKKYLDVLYYKICNEERNNTELYNNNKENCEEYKNIIYPEIMIIYMDIINNIKLNKNHYSINIDITNKINLLKNYVNIYSYDQNSSS